MTKFRLVPVLLCLGLLGALPFLISQPKLDTVEPSAQQQAAIQPDAPLRAAIGEALNQARDLVEAGEYKQALAVIDGLDGIPDKTEYERSIIGQMRDYAIVKSTAAADRQTR